MPKKTKQKQIHCPLCNAQHSPPVCPNEDELYKMADDIRFMDDTPRKMEGEMPPQTPYPPEWHG